MKRLVIVAMCFCAQQCLAQTAPSADIKTLKVKYEQGLAAIQEDTNKALANSVQGYADALKALGRKLQGAGDLDGMLAVKKESERFEKEKAIPESAVVADCVALKDLQLRWQKMPDAIDVSKSKKIVTLSGSHIAALEELKKQLTMQGQVDEAVEAKNEIERVRTSAEVTAAEFVLTNAGIDLAAKTNAVAKALAPRRVDQLSSLRSSLVLYYSFDRDEGGKVTDKSGKRSDAVVRGAKYTSSGKRGGAYEFDGVQDLIEGSKDNALPTGRSPKTVSVWVKPQNVGGTILKYGNDSHVTAQGFCFIINGNWTIWLAGYYTDVVSKGKLTQNEWNHLCVTYDSSTARIYINGRLDTSGKLSQSIPTGTNLQIGHNALSGNTGYFNGGIDELMVFNRALSDSEVKQIYDAQK